MLEAASGRVERLEDLVSDDCRAERHVSAGDALGEGDDVRAHAPVLMREHATGAAKAGDHLVENQQHAVAIADLAYAREIVVGRDQDAAARDDRLHDEGPDALDAFAEDRPLERGCAVGMVPVGVRRLGEDESGDERLVAELPLGLAGRAECAERIAVVAPIAGDDLVAPRVPCLRVVLAHHLEGHLVRFGTAIREVGLRRIPEELDELRGKADGGLVAHRHGRERELRHLLAGDLCELLASVPDVYAPDARHRVEPAPAVGIDEEAAFAPLHEPGWSVLEALVL